MLPLPYEFAAGRTFPARVTKVLSIRQKKRRFALEARDPLLAAIRLSVGYSGYPPPEPTRDLVAADNA